MASKEDINETAASEDCPVTPTPTDDSNTTAHGSSAISTPKPCGDTYGVSDRLLQQLLGMDVPLNLAVRALQCSGNATVSAAFDWLASMSPEEAEALASKPLFDDDSEWEDVSEGEDEEAKMVLVVNTALGMRPGKVAAQVGHAVLGLWRVMDRRGGPRHTGAVRLWEDGGERKVVLKAKSDDQLVELKREAQRRNLCTFLVADAGLTQVPEGSRTVLGIFGMQESVDAVTRDLKLL